MTRGATFSQKPSPKKFISFCPIRSIPLTRNRTSLLFYFIFFLTSRSIFGKFRNPSPNQRGNAFKFWNLERLFVRKQKSLTGSDEIMKSVQTDREKERGRGEESMSRGSYGNVWTENGLGDPGFPGAKTVTYTGLSLPIPLRIKIFPLFLRLGFILIQIHLNGFFYLCDGFKRAITVNYCAASLSLTIPSFENF